VSALQTFRTRFHERFPGADPEYSEILIGIAEAMVGDEPIASNVAEGYLDVAAAKLSGQEWVCPDAIEPATDSAVTSTQSNGFLEEGFRRMSEADNRAPSGRPIVRGSVYCVQPVSGGRIKIGFTTDVGARFHTLNGSGPEPLILLAHARTYDFVEREIHAQLATHRRHCEWFDDTPDVREVVANLAATCARHEKARPMDLPPPKGAA
jgi:hypothetical protein